MKKIIVALISFCFFGFSLGCSNNIVFVRALQQPKWPVHHGRTIGIVPVLEGKHGSDRNLTLELAATLSRHLKKSAYYSRAACSQTGSGEYIPGENGELIPATQTIDLQAHTLGTDLLFFVEVLGARVLIGIDRGGFGIGLGAGSAGGAFGTAMTTATDNWSVDCSIIISAILINSRTREILASRVEEFSIIRLYKVLLPSESAILSEMLAKAANHILSLIHI